MKAHIERNRGVHRSKRGRLAIIVDGSGRQRYDSLVAMNIHIHSTTALGMVAALALMSCAPGQAQLLMNASLHASVVVEMPPPPPPRPAVELQSQTVVEFFGIPLDDAQDLVFVLDVSGSMEETASGRIASLPADKKEAVVEPSAPQSSTPNVPPQSNPPPGAPPLPPRRPSKIEVARGELMAALERLPPQTRLNVIFFSDELIAYAPTMVALQEAERSDWLGFISAARATGGTAMAPALRAAFMLNARRVVVLSDGMGNVDGNDTDVLRDAREAMRGGVRIDTIGIGVGQNRQLLTLLARESGGLYQAF